MKKTITLYYDLYEKNYGDGFYPLLYKDLSCNQQIDIDFELIDNKLIQHNGPSIKGYDGNTYNDIIKIILLK